MIQSSIASIGYLLLQRIMNTFGIDVVTAITTAYKIDTLTILSIINISTAISVFVGQNIDANNMARAKEGLKKGNLTRAIAGKNQSSRTLPYKALLLSY